MILDEVGTITARTRATETPRLDFLYSGDSEMQRRYLVLATALALAVAATLNAGTGEADARCVPLDSRIAELRLKLRMGYSASQGRLYRQKVASLEAERKSLCRKGR